MCTRTAFMTSVVVCAILFNGCASDKRKADDGMQMELYRKVAALTRQYTDSLKRCDGDSATVGKLMEAYEDKLMKINMQMPRGTDMKLTADYNDTIYRLTTKLLAERDKALDVRNDTTAVDSLPAESKAEDKVARKEHKQHK